MGEFNLAYRYILNMVIIWNGRKRRRKRKRRKKEKKEKREKKEERGKSMLFFFVFLVFFWSYWGQRLDNRPAPAPINHSNLTVHSQCFTAHQRQ